ncbi:GntR family transcriptional regulator [Mycobacterium tuberculosis]|nr:GntR family transcriptional regulator [Mycobacterium tuberculosis]
MYVAVRDALMAGELEPGSKLKLAALAERFDASLSVLREAMTKLAGDGLVTVSPQRGFRVMDLSVEDLRDLTRARVLVETAALGESVRVGDVAWEAELLAAHHTLMRTPWTGSNGRVQPEWAAAHHAFHTALSAGCGSDHMVTVAGTLRHRADLYSQWSQRLGGATRDVVTEHQEIMEKTMARDVEGARAALAAHIERSTSVLLANVAARTTSASENGR